MALSLALLVGLLSAPALFARSQLVDLGALSNTGMTPQESAQLQNYTDTLSREWLKKVFKIDVDAFDLALDQLRIGDLDFALLDREEKFGPASGNQAGGSGTLSGGQGKDGFEFRFKLMRVGDLRQLAYDSRDVPFALKMETDRLIGGEGMRLETSLSLPLSHKGEFAASASLPLPALDAKGFGNRWKLSSIYSNRLGISSVDTGLGTRWMGDWDLGFDSRIRFGTGTYETSQWFKLGRTF